MRKKLTGVVAIMVLFAAALFIPKSAEAVPAFARQTGMACNACHFQHFPALNAFGRAFKAGDYTMAGGQSLIEGDFLSLPSSLNASVVTKVRYQKTNGDVDDSGTNKGELQFPDEAALFLGGRVGEHIGFIIEGQMADDAAPMFASFKLPIGYDVGPAHLSFIPFKTDAFGPQFSFELLNTGAVRNIRTFEERTAISAVQFAGLQEAAQGFGFVASHNTGYVNYTAWQNANGASVSKFLHYVRVAATPTIAGWDLGAGIQLWTGSTVDGAKNRNVAEGWAVDAQAQGLVGNFPLGVYLQYALANKSETDKPANIFNGNPNDETAFSIAAELGVLPGRATVGLGYRQGDTGANTDSEDNALLVAATYNLVQNVQFQLNHTWFSGDKYDPLPANGDQRTTLMIFAAF